ncbi:MAG: hypothetical protein KDB37_15690 [Ilumatobacter sp.]|nr:hypothetical protein [Ilumatobacter sp.]
MRHIHPPRSLALLVPVALAMTLAACGDDSEPAADEPVDTVADAVPPTTVPPTTVPPTTAAPAGYEHPTGADEVVVSITHEGGFVPVETIFSQLPSLLVTGDARQFTLGPQIAIYPGPLLPNVQVAAIGEDGVQDLLALADEYGLLEDREYEVPTNIADASDTVVTITADGATYVHRAYALGLGAGPGVTDESGDRADLQAFVEAATMMDETPTDTFASDAYLVRSFPTDDLSGYDIEPTIVAWPLADVDLAAASDCVEIAAADIGDVFATANQLTFFEQDGVVYRLAVKPQLPGDAC